MVTGLLIVLENTDTGKALPICRVQDPVLLRMAARAALAEKRGAAQRFAGVDAHLAVVADVEVARLETTLRALIPDCEETALAV